ncbi:MAG TPA: orotate phosphoribosyltransferase [Candidatus Dormibacteraeota bacterium]|nr:orotate phosphoribosyltransferase [Candidatus Dormibacteraeota bacterium]
MSEFESGVGRVPDFKWLQKVIVERAIVRGDYTTSGGHKTDFYIDKFRLFSDPTTLRRIARMFAPAVAEIAPDLIGGTELGGVILATAVSQMASLPMIVVRKQPKAYGAFANEYVEGDFSEGQRVLLLEDVVTSGKELMAASARLEEMGLKVECRAMVNRGLAPVKALLQFSLPSGTPRTDN